MRFARKDRFVIGSHPRRNTDRFMYPLFATVSVLSKRIMRIYKQQPVLYALGLEVVAIAGVTNISDIKLPC